jgi:O-antigen ligase
VTAAVCLATGIIAGVNPKYGVAVPLGIAFAAAVLANVTVGLFLFTFLSWMNMLTKGGTVVSGAKVAGLLLFVSWVGSMAIRRDPDARPLSETHPGVTTAAVLLATWSALSVVWAHSRGAATTSTYMLILDLLLFPIIFYAIRRRDHFAWILAAYILGALISSLISLHQSGSSRQTGLIGDADREGTLLAVALILLFGLLAYLPSGSTVRRWGPVGLLVLTVGLVNAGSRGGLLALGVGLAAGVVVGGRWRYKALTALIVAGTVGGLYLTVLAPQTAASNHLIGTHTTGRSDLWKLGLRAFESHPIGGVGAANFSSVSEDYLKQVGSVGVGQLIISQKPKQVHNTYLELLADLGIPGLIAFLAIAVGSVSAALKAAHIYERLADTRMELMSRCVALAVIAALTGSFFITATPEKLLWVILALPFPLLAIARSEAQVPQPG